MNFLLFSMWQESWLRYTSHLTTSTTGKGLTISSSSSEKPTGDQAGRDSWPDVGYLDLPGWDQVLILDQPVDPLEDGVRLYSFLDTNHYTQVIVPINHTPASKDRDLWLPSHSWGRSDGQYWDLVVTLSLLNVNPCWVQWAFSLHILGTICK